MDSANQRIVKYVIPVFVLSIIIVTIFLSDSFEALGEKEDKEKKEKVIKENQKKDNKIIPLRGQLTLGSETSVAKLQEIGIETIKKIHPKVLAIITDKNPDQKAKQYGAKFKDNKLDTYIYLKQGYLDDPPKNIKVLAKSENILVSKLSFDEILQLAALESVERIDLPIKAKFFGHAASEGVAFSFADALIASGITGKSFVLAVIDSGFDTSNPEISGPRILSTSFDPMCDTPTILCNDTLNESHGTAVAEIIVDMAPDVKLRLYAVIDLVAFNNAVDDAKNKNVKVITASLGFPTLGGDGTTGFFRDGTSSAAKKVNEARNAGIFVTVAAGNQAESHWQGNYTISPVPASSIPNLNSLIPGSYESVMDFNPFLDPADPMRACLPVNDVGGSEYVISWNAWANTTEDYAVFLYEPDMSDLKNPIFGSDEIQSLTPPLESFITFPAQGDVCLVLASFLSSQNHFFHINTEQNPIDPSFFVREGSIDTPADASGAFTVGAIDHDTDTLEPFSSRGPTDPDTLNPSGRNKPEICGPDFTLTHQTSLNPPLPGFFPGTSAATPHVAGAAMLLLEQDTTLTADQIHDKLISDARFNAGYSVDNLCGLNSGALRLPPLPCSPPVSGDWTVTFSCTLESDAVIELNVIVQNNSVITILPGVTLDIDFENNKLEIKFGSGVRIKAGGTLT